MRSALLRRAEGPARRGVPRLLRCPSCDAPLVHASARGPRLVQRMHRGDRYRCSPCSTEVGPEPHPGWFEVLDPGPP